MEQPTLEGLLECLLEIRRSPAWEVYHQKIKLLREQAYSDLMDANSHAEMLEARAIVKAFTAVLLIPKDLNDDVEQIRHERKLRHGG